MSIDVIKLAEPVDIAKKMARAAGKVTPQAMAEACYMLICCAAMSKDADAYIDFLSELEKKNGS